MKEIQSPRLILRAMSPDADAEFIRRLLNEESFLRFIGNRGVRTLDDARRYVRNGPLESYARHGFGLMLVLSREEGEPVGICGLLQRPSLDAPDLGFAFVPEAWGRGLAFEASEAVLADGRGRLGLRRVVAVTQPDNAASIRLLERLGFGYEKRVSLSEDGPSLCLYVTNL